MSDTAREAVLVGGQPPRFDWSDPRLAGDRYGVYAELRRSGELCRSGPGQWAAARYEHVYALLKAPELANRFPPEYQRFVLGDGEVGRILQGDQLARNNGEVGAFLAEAVRRHVAGGMQDRVRAEVARLLAPAQEIGALDAVGDLAMLLAPFVVLDLLGVEGEERAEALALVGDVEWGSRGRRVLAEGMETPGRTGERQDPDAGVVRLRAILERIVQARRRGLGPDRDDVLSALLGVAPKLSLSDDDVIDNAVVLVLAACETSMHAVTNGCATLAHHPQAWAELRRCPALLGSTVDEVLRFESPVQVVLRYVREPLSIGGRVLRPGRVVALLLGSANRDETVFPAANRFVPSRSPNPHLSFGGGLHECIGRTAARLSATVALDELARRFSVLEPAGEFVSTSSPTFRGFLAVPLAVVPA